MAPEPGIDEPPVWQGGDRPGGLGIGDKRDVIVGGLYGAEAGLGERDAVCRKLLEVGGFQARLQNDRACDHPHAARPKGGKASCAASASALTPSGSLGRPGTCTSEAEIDVVMPPCT